MNTYAMRTFLLALVARVSGLGARQPPELTTVTIRSVTITSTRTVTTNSVLWANTTMKTLPPIEPSTASVSNITGGIPGTGATAATSAITEVSVSRTKGSCITITPNLSIRPSPPSPTNSTAVSRSTEGGQKMSSAAIPWPRPGIADPPEAPLSSFSVSRTTSSSPVTSSKPDTMWNSTSIGWSSSPTISSTKLLNSTSESSDLPTSTSSETFTTKTSSQIASVSTATASDGTGYGEGTVIQPTVDPSRPDQSSSSFSPMAPIPSISPPSSTIHVVAIDVLGFE
ncbi:hypothetical protein F5Y00DRAFT_272452 [Daldinia vernicosa]|uniref:uncharacterized protein n=1 Tax=Daldinia vernicosa TaxID=114800 RepID=UPI0020083AC8|nr:uncharacterized protein F5Y00DRAFT_272452 [Daldinia vernicosa]KAI0852829.1 hypothetical protein F5Y00DRAFT_272452 [Daldinia vernicosa]